MFQLFYTPNWFNGWDLIFDSVSLFVALLIAAYSWRMYRISGENKFGYFSFAFILVCLSFIFRILTQSLVYFALVRNAATEVIAPIVGRGVSGVNYSDLFFRSGFFLTMVTLLGAWLLIYFISQRRSGRLKKYYEVSQIALFVYLVVLVSIVSNFKYFVFYLTSLVILGMTVLNYYKNYLNSGKNKNALLVMLSFLALVVGNLFFIFVFVNPLLYVFGEVFILGGFLLLLYTYSHIKRRQGKTGKIK